MAEPIQVSRRDGIATVTLNRPDKLNAMTVEMYRLFGEAFDELSADPETRCVVVRGAGGRAFCVGSDIAEFDAERSDPDQAKAYGKFTISMTDKLKDCPHPTIALIEGACVGGGFEIAAMCDIRICGENSRFGIPINRLGLTVDYDELQILVEAFGHRTTLEILLEGRVFGAQEAFAKGIVSRVVPEGSVHEEAYASAERIAAAAPLVNRWHKRFVRRLMSQTPLSEAERNEAFECYGTEDYRTGRTAFVEKRQPVFRGR